MQTIVSVTELNVGDKIAFYGGEFEIVKVTESRGHIDGYAAYGRFDDFVGPSPVAVARGRFIGGKPCDGYFGPSKDFTFQGNALTRLSVIKR